MELAEEKGIRGTDKIKVISVRGTAFPPVAREGGNATIENAAGAGSSGLSRFLGAAGVYSQPPDPADLSAVFGSPKLGLAIAATPGLAGHAATGTFTQFASSPF